MTPTEKRLKQMTALFNKYHVSKADGVKIIKVLFWLAKHGDDADGCFALKGGSK